MDPLLLFKPCLVSDFEGMTPVSVSPEDSSTILSDGTEGLKKQQLQNERDIVKRLESEKERLD